MIFDPDFGFDDVQRWEPMDEWWAAGECKVLGDRHLPNGVRQHIVDAPWLHSWTVIGNAIAISKNFYDPFIRVDTCHIIRAQVMHPDGVTRTGHLILDGPFKGRIVRRFGSDGKIKELW